LMKSITKFERRTRSARIKLTRRPRTAKKHQQSSQKRSISHSLKAHVTVAERRGIEARNVQRKTKIRKNGQSTRRKKPRSFKMQ
jgi:hypothetical protein